LTLRAVIIVCNYYKTLLLSKNAQRVWMCRSIQDLPKRPYPTLMDSQTDNHQHQVSRSLGLSQLLLPNQLHHCVIWVHRFRPQDPKMHLLSHYCFLCV